MKKLINEIDDVVTEQLQGMAAAHPDLLKVNYDPNYVYRADAPVAGKVAIVSGGGSGHEPMHGGFVGMGMLDGACPGEVFTSPTPDQMYECAKAVDSGAGVLYIVKNYTGDVMNFEMAAEMAHADGIKVQNILIDDDVAVKIENALVGEGRRRQQAQQQPARLHSPEPSRISGTAPTLSAAFWKNSRCAKSNRPAMTLLGTDSMRVL